MANLEPNDSIVLMQNQLHGNSKVILNGELVSIEGNSATVLIAGEEVPREVSLDQLQKADDVFGGEIFAKLIYRFEAAVFDEFSEGNAGGSRHVAGA